MSCKMFTVSTCTESVSPLKLHLTGLYACIDKPGSATKHLENYTQMVLNQLKKTPAHLA